MSLKSAAQYYAKPLKGCRTVLGTRKSVSKSVLKDFSHSKSSGVGTENFSRDSNSPKTLLDYKGHRDSPTNQTTDQLLNTCSLLPGANYVFSNKHVSRLVNVSLVVTQHCSMEEAI